MRSSCTAIVEIDVGIEMAGDLIRGVRHTIDEARCQMLWSSCTNVEKHVCVDQATSTEPLWQIAVRTCFVSGYNSLAYLRRTEQIDPVPRSTDIAQYVSRCL